MKKNNTKQYQEDQLEKQIMQDVYRFEAKKTSQTILKLGLIITLSLNVVLFLGILTFNILKEQQTLDLLQLFTEDISVIQENFMDVFYTFYVESPHLLILLLATFLLIFLVTLFVIIKNYKKIKKKFLAIKHFFKK